MLMVGCNKTPNISDARIVAGCEVDKIDMQVKYYNSASSRSVVGTFNIDN